MNPLDTQNQPSNTTPQQPAWDPQSAAQNPIIQNTPPPGQPTSVVPIAPIPSSPTPPQPAFKNPLAQGYVNHTASLPPEPSTPTTPISPITQVQPTSPPLTPVAPQPTAIAPANPLLANTNHAANSEVTYQAPAPVPAPRSEPSPNVHRISEEILGPAPVRLAPVPKADDSHAQGLQSASSVTPFGGLSGGVSQPTVAQLNTAPKKRSPIIIIVSIVGAVLVIGVALAIFGLMGRRPVPTPTTTTTTLPSAQRDKTEKALAPFAEKVTTDCYVIQAPSPVQIQDNKNCSLSIVYGEQKISSIFVSPQREFDLVAGTTSPSASPNSSSEPARFDSQKYLDSLIVNAITQDQILSRETIKVAGLDATKVVKKAADGKPGVAYVFIVMPESDRKFQEKTFIAFIVTGAYNDDVSRKAFDQALSNWYWK